jgi:hypothetical protein
MLPISDEYLQSPCEIKDLNNELLTTATINKFVNDDIQIANEYDILPILHCNMPVKINIYNSSLGFKVLIGKVFLSTSDMMQISDLQNLAEFERRDFFRLKVKIKSQGHTIEPEDSNSDEEEIQFFEITVTDISLGGLFILTRERLEIGQQFAICLKLYEIDIVFRCRVQRIQNDDDTYNGYGCSFVDNSTRQFDLLCKFIFEKQREQIKILRETQY